MTSRDSDHDSREDLALPGNPEHHQAETVDALEAGAPRGAGEDDQPVAGEDVTENPDTDELEGLPGPSTDQPGESAG